MTPHDLLAAFDVLAEAPGGTQRLRALVLELAVRGKLVPQDPRDEPASALLERIAAEKARLVEAGKIRASKPLPPVHEDEVPFEVPEGWRWCRLDDLLVDGPSNGWSPKAVPFETKTRTLSLSATTRGFFDPAQYKYVEAELPPDSSLWLRNGDLLIQRSNTPEYVGMAAIYDRADGEFIYPDLMMRCRLSRGASTQFVHRFLLSASGRGWFQARASGTSQSMVKIGQQVVRNAPIPIAPLAEQRRIVARVDELMAVLDRLEAARGAREAARVGLRDAALAALRDAPDAAAVEVAWARVAERMDELFTAPADVAPLRQTILQLAVRGHLVPQDPRDEPASALLDPRQQELAKVDIPFELPAGWAWTCLSNLGDFLSGGTPSKSTPGYWNGDIPWVSPKDMKVTWLKDSQDHVSRQALDNTSLRLVPQGSVLMVVRGMILAHSFPVASNLRDVTINQDMKALVPFRSELVPFLVLLLRGTRDRMLQLIERSTHGTCKMPFRSLSLLPLALPPLAEQKRIVARVDELMALCDQLEARLRAVHDVQAAFAAAAVHHLDT